MPRSLTNSSEDLIHKLTFYYHAVPLRSPHSTSSPHTLAALQPLISSPLSSHRPQLAPSLTHTCSDAFLFSLSLFFRRSSPPLCSKTLALYPPLIQPLLSPPASSQSLTSALKAPVVTGTRALVVILKKSLDFSFFFFLLPLK